jgi:uncharacterized protein with HEPN domain
VPSSDPIQRFLDILENIGRIEEFTADMDRAAFSQNNETVYAVKHALLIISEAARKLAGVAEELCPEIPWAKVRGLGNPLRHEYYRIDVARLWLLIEGDLPPLKTAAQAALRTLQEREEQQ